MLELALQQYERIGSHVGVQQRAVPVVSFAAVERQPIAKPSRKFRKYIAALRSSANSNAFRSSASRLSTE